MKKEPELESVHLKRIYNLEHEVKKLKRKFTLIRFYVLWIMVLALVIFEVVGCNFVLESYSTTIIDGDISVDKPLEAFIVIVLTLISVCLTLYIFIHYIFKCED